MEIQHGWEDGVDGNFRVNTAITAVLPPGTRIKSASSHGISAWSKTAKLNVVLQDGSPRDYFLKVTAGQNGRGLAQGEFVSARAINDAVPGFGADLWDPCSPEPTGWGVYHDGVEDLHFFVGEFHDLDLATAPDPVELVGKLVNLHLNGAVPGGKYGWDVSTGFASMQRTAQWDDTWVKGFTRQLQDVIDMDNNTNGRDPRLDAARKQLIEAVIPRLLGALESDGRSIEPTLVHGDIWERNCGIDMETGNVLIFDPGCTYAHNEMEFGTWRCTWAYHFASPVYMQLYQSQIEPSEPSDQWDDRNRLYSMFPYLNNSGGRPGSTSRVIAHNDMLYLIEKYAPWDSDDKYDPKKDPKVPGSQISATTFMDE